MTTTIIQEKINKNNINDIWNKINKELLENSNLEILITKTESNIDNAKLIELVKQNPVMIDLDPILYQNEIRNER